MQSKVAGAGRTTFRAAGNEVRPHLVCTAEAGFTAGAGVEFFWVWSSPAMEPEEATRRVVEPSDVDYFVGVSVGGQHSPR